MCVFMCVCKGTALMLLCEHNLVSVGSWSPSHLCFLLLLFTTRCGKSSTVDCFLGCELVDWLQQVGLAQDRGEAVLYGTQLQQGGVLQHIGQEYCFQDGRLYYRFIT